MMPSLMIPESILLIASAVIMRAIISGTFLRLVLVTSSFWYTGIGVQAFVTNTTHSSQLNPGPLLCLSSVKRLIVKVFTKFV